MENDFHLNLLGPVHVERSGEPLTGFKSRKALALLCYLGTQAHPVERSYLAMLFWPNNSESRARNNLSQAMHNLLTLWPECLKADRQIVQFNQTDANWVDINAFEKFVAKGDAVSLMMAVDLYHDDFMAGMYLDDCPEFEQWLRLEQESWRQRVTLLLQDLVDYYVERNALEQALELTTRLLDIDPGHEEAHCQRMMLLARNGQRNAALAQYELCCRILAEELSVEPTSATTELYEQIKAGKLQHNVQNLGRRKISLPDVSSSQVAPSPYSNLPVLSNPFIGRDTELAIIDKQLQNPNCRLLSIVGLGGIGKTRLAIQAASAAKGFKHGGGFVPLTSVSSAEFIISTIADVLQFPLYGHRDPKAQLINFLSDKEMLLVLDNFEHLLSGASVLADVLQGAPQVKFLVTSRERLGLYEEWVLDLRGLSFPESKQDSNIERYPATQLFLQRSQQVRADFWLTYLDKPAIARICQLVEGLPLGIELAAAWTRTLSCQDIAAEIEKNYNFLTSSLQDIPGRHRSIQAVFEHSWQLLSEEEQGVFRKLSVFWGGFTRNAAERVVGASALLLSALVDKSLLRRVSSDRYEIHELVRQFGAEKLAENPEEKKRVKNLHARYYAEFLQAQEVRLKRGKQEEVLKVISIEIDNVRAGWYWAVAQRREREFEKYREGLFLIHNMQSWFHEGEAVFAKAATVLRKIKRRYDPDRKTDKMLGQILARQGVFCASLGQYDKARKILQEGLSIFQDPDLRREAPLSLNYLGAIAWALGKYVQAKHLCQESLTRIAKMGDRWKEALVLEYLGMIAISLGEYLEAKAMAEKNLAIFREFGHRSGIAFSLNMYGIAARNLGEYTEAKEACQESLIIAREIGDRWEEALSLQYLGLIAISLGQYAEAKQLARQSLAIYQKFDYQSGILLALDLQGIAARNLGEYAEAKRLHQEVLRTSKAMDYQLGIALASYYLGCIAYLTGDHHQAERLLTESLTLAKKLAYQRGVSENLRILGNVAFAQGKNQEAKQYLYEALRTAQGLHATPMTLDILTGLANLLVEEGRTERAVELIAFPLSHTASKKETKDEAKRLFSKLKSQLSNDIIETARKKGQRDRLEELVEEILAEKMDEELVLVA